jgi:DNA-directed RNA polymerase subunit RPC12/RpoP
MNPGGSGFPGGIGPSGGDPSLPFQEQYQVVYQCESCKATFTDKLKPGDKCPKCGIRFAYVEDENGNREYAGLGGLGWGSIGAVVLIVIGVVVKAIMSRS